MTGGEEKGSNVMSKANKIECPHCKNEIDVSELLYHQLSEKVKKEHQEKTAKDLNKINKEREYLEKQRQDIENKKREIDTTLNKRFEQEKPKLESALRRKMEKEVEGEIQLLRDELNEKSGQVKDLNKSKAENERLKREKDELRGKIQLEAEKNYSQRLSQEKEKIEKSVKSEFEFQMLEQHKRIDGFKKEINELKRKAEQGSQQLQGEIQEIAIESWLKEQFPLDSIKEVKKGQTGADCLQTVLNNSGQVCGIIYYESKRTKTFQKSWLEKFKSDMQDRKADIGVIVTATMPSGMERFGQKDGIWICSFDEFKGLCSVLRESIIQISTVAVSQKNKGSKMEMLYGFLTSSEFRLQVESIVEGFSTLKTNLDSEKRAMNRVWKERETQIERVMSSTTKMYASIRGIAGNAVQSVQSLELPSGEEGSE